MDKEISDMMEKFSDMIKNPSSSNVSSKTDSDSSHISSDMLNQFASFFPKNHSSDKADKPSFDMETLLKMKSIMEKMNEKEDPRSHLLLSLKPYLRPKRKEKLDQYITLFNMSRVMDFLKESGGGKKQ